MIVEVYSRRPKIIEFQKLFERLLPKMPTQREAYEYAEKYWKKKNGKRKYKNYESFKKGRYHYFANIKTKG